MAGVRPEYGRGMAGVRPGYGRSTAGVRPECVRKPNSKKILPAQQGSLMKGGLVDVGITGDPVEVVAQQVCLIKNKKKMLTATGYYDRL